MSTQTDSTAKSAGFTGPMLDRLLIRELIGSYSDAAFQGDRQAWLDCWTDDGVWFVLGQEVRGKDALRQQWDQLWRMLDKMTFFTEVGAIAVDGDKARMRCYTQEIFQLKDGSVRQIIGSYEDRLIRKNETWLFARREHCVLIDATPQ